MDSATTAGTYVPYSERPYWSVPLREWGTPLLFMFSLSLLGLSFYPAVLVIFTLLLRAFRHDRYSMIIMLTLFAGAYGYVSENSIGVKNSDLFLAISAVLMFIYVKPPLVRRAVLILGLYAVALLILASFSLESMSVQFVTMRYYLLFAFFIIPVVCFTGEEFDIDMFFRRVIQYGMIACAFYIADGVILGSNILVPQTFNWGTVPTFTSVSVHPFSIIRKYPPGLYILFMAVYPLARFYRLQVWQWLFVAAAVLTTQTFTLISAVLLSFVICQGRVRQLVKWILYAFGGLLLLFAVDSILPYRSSDDTQSTLRIRSTFDQFVAVTEAVDVEDVAQFASGRMAQIIPKVELVNREHKQWTGLGFLHPDKTKIARYFIENEYYVDVSKSDELAFGVENAPVQIWLTIGYIGLLVHAAFLLALYYTVRRLKYRAYFGSILFTGVWMGLSGWFMLINIHGLIMLGLSYGVVLLANIDKTDR